MRYTKTKYLSAIDALKLGMTQLEPDGNVCAICGDCGHQAWECHHNPLEGLRHIFAHRCFHCGIVAFTQEEAEDHFGKESDEIAKCIRRQNNDWLSKENYVWDFLKVFKNNKSGAQRIS